MFDVDECEVEFVSRLILRVSDKLSLWYVVMFDSAGDTESELSSSEFAAGSDEPVEREPEVSPTYVLWDESFSTDVKLLGFDVDEFETELVSPLIMISDESSLWYEEDTEPELDSSELAADPVEPLE